MELKTNKIFEKLIDANNLNDAQKNELENYINSDELQKAIFETGIPCKTQEELNLKTVLHIWHKLNEIKQD